MDVRRLLVIFALTPWTAFGATCSVSKPEAFEAFFQQFSGERAFAVERTVLPLKMLRWEYGANDDGKDESAPKMHYLARKDYLKWPTLGTYLDKTGLRSKVQKLTRTKAIVDVFKPDTDLTVLWHFKLRAGCWYFWQYEDQSL